MYVFEVVVAMLLVGAALAALARRLGAPYPALVGLAGAGLALVPGLPSLVLDPQAHPHAVRGARPEGRVHDREAPLPG